MRHRVDGSLCGKVRYPALFSIGVLSSLGSVQAKAADLPLEGTFATTYTVVDVGNKELPASAKHEGFSGELHIIQQNDSGSGFFHRATGYCLFTGGITAQGALKSNGRCLYTDPEGDTFHTVWESKKDGKDSPQTTSGIFIDGTGKYVGIEGEFQNRIGFLKSAVEGKADFGIGHTTGKYKIVR
jgi:hypothetical protein